MCLPNFLLQNTLSSWGALKFTEAQSYNLFLRRRNKKNRINLYIVKMCPSGLLCINVVMWDLKKIFWALEKPQNLGCYLLTVVRVCDASQLKIILLIVSLGIPKGKVSPNVICSYSTINIKKMQWYKILNMYVHMNLIGTAKRLLSVQRNLLVVSI